MALWSIGITILLCGVVIISDLYARRVPNKALLIALCLGAVVLLLPASNSSTAISAFGGMALGLVALLPFHLLGWMGAGDVKFFAVLGFLLGPDSLLPVWLLSMILLSLHGAALWLWRGSSHWRTVILANALGIGSHRLHLLNQQWQTRLSTARGSRHGMPYAAHLGVSALAWMAWGQRL